jgi:hypothetical protein
MRFTVTLFAIAAAVISVHAGTAEVCTNNKDGSGGASYQITSRRIAYV